MKRLIDVVVVEQCATMIAIGKSVENIVTLKTFV